MQQRPIEQSEDARQGRYLECGTVPVPAGILIVPQRPHMERDAYEAVRAGFGAMDARDPITSKLWPQVQDDMTF